MAKRANRVVVGQQTFAGPERSLTSSFSLGAAAGTFLRQNTQTRRFSERSKGVEKEGRDVFSVQIIRAGLLELSPGCQRRPEG